MQAFLNELSFPYFESHEKAKSLFDSLGFFYKTVHEVGIKTIRIRANFFQQEFAEGYSFGTWMTDRNTDSDLRTLLVGILSTPPFVDEIFQDYEKRNDKPLEFYFGNQLCYGLGLASNLIYDTVAFSYDSGTWTADTYDILLKTLGIDGNDELSEEELLAKTRNITHGKHLEIHRGFIQEKLKQAIRNGEELWRVKDALFPGLIFCEVVLAQIKGMDSSSPDFQQVLNRIFELQNFTAKWDGSAIKPSDFQSKVTPESATRLDNFSSQLTILCPDGNHRLFSWHARYTPGAGRIHFFPLGGQRKFLIGSIANQNSIKGISKNPC